MSIYFKQIVFRTKNNCFLYIFFIFYQLFLLITPLDFLDKFYFLDSYPKPNPKSKPDRKPDPKPNPKSKPDRKPHPKRNP